MVFSLSPKDLSDVQNLPLLKTAEAPCIAGPGDIWDQTMSRECPAAVRISTSPMAFFLLLKNLVMDLDGLRRQCMFE